MFKLITCCHRGSILIKLRKNTTNIAYAYDTNTGFFLSLFSADWQLCTDMHIIHWNRNFHTIYSDTALQKNNTLTFAMNIFVFKYFKFFDMDINWKIADMYSDGNYMTI